MKQNVNLWKHKTKQVFILETEIAKDYLSWIVIVTVFIRRNFRYIYKVEETAIIDICSGLCLTCNRL